MILFLEMFNATALEVSLTWNLSRLVGPEDKVILGVWQSSYEKNTSNASSSTPLASELMNALICMCAADV